MTLYRSLLICLLALTFTGGAETQSGGILLIEKTPSTYVELVPYSTLQQEPVYVTAVLASRETRQYRKGSILVRIPYPAASLTGLTEEDARTQLLSIQKAAAAYPQYKSQLNEMLARWQNVVNVLMATKARQPPPAKGPQMLLGKLSYEDPKLVGFDGTAAEIEHASGVAKIPISDLTKAQITALNATSSVVKIDPSKTPPKPSVSPTTLIASNWIAATGPSTTGQPSYSKAGLTPAQFAYNKAIEQKDPETAQWNSLAPNSDMFVAPDIFGQTGPPTYEETIAFINGKVGPAMSVGFGEKTKKMIIRFNYLNGPGFTAVFDPKDLNAEVRWEKRTIDFGDGIIQTQRTEGRVILRTRDRKSSIMLLSPGRVEGGRLKLTEELTDAFVVGNTVDIDELDAEKVANAFSHLIYMFGGTKEAF